MWKRTRVFVIDALGRNRSLKSSSNRRSFPSFGPSRKIRDRIYCIITTTENLCGHKMAFQRHHACTRLRYLYRYTHLQLILFYIIYTRDVIMMCTALLYSVILLWSGNTSTQPLMTTKKINVFNIINVIKINNINIIVIVVIIIIITYFFPFFVFNQTHTERTV
jgi:hypothetical protein